jgi:UDP-N-acetylmuramate: L-alanyl-gamma-D-glutamyl-meso-diaminopimelate ligase
MQEACHVYMLPIGGTAMASLAGLLQAAGDSVCGVDAVLYPPMSDLLAELGIPVRLGFDPSTMPRDIGEVVIGNAVPRTNVEVEAVLARGLPYTSQAEAFGLRFCRGHRAVVVAGTHGKTTTAALAAHLFVEAGLDPTVLVGGVPRGGRPFRLGRGGWTVVEGDEYNTAFFDKGPKFLHYDPHLFVVNNVEFDHADIYPNLDAILAAFRAGVACVGTGGSVVANASDEGARAATKGARRVVWYGRGDRCDLRCERWTHRGGRLVASLAWAGRRFRVEMPLPGRHNLDNLMAATTCALLAGVDDDCVVAAAASFGGVCRRLEIVGEAAGITVIDDFAHHPTAVRLTLEAARRRFPGRRLVAVFEPRSLTAGRRTFATAYASAFRRADVAVLAPVFHRGRLGPGETLDREALVAGLRKRGHQAAAVPDGDDTLGVALSRLRPGDVAICMSSGDFGGLPRRLLASLAGRR